MATNNPYEEEQKRQVQMPVYENSSPQGTYYGEQGNQESDMAEEILRRAAEQADPQRQAEEDARIQRSRQFWTGANLFTNVVANAINVNGTAKGAPNMTFNDAASQKMYDTWRTADQQLRAERKASQQRFDALRMQDAQMRAKGAGQRAAEQQRAADMNFNIGLEQARYDRAKADEQEKWERNQQAASDAADLAYERQKELTRMRHPGGGGSGSGSSNNLTISIGSADITAKSDREAKQIRRDVARQLVDKENAAIDARNEEKRKKNKFIDEKELEKHVDYPKNDKMAGDIIYLLGDYYDNDDDFRNWANTTYGIEDIYSVDNPVAQPQSASATASASSGGGGETRSVKQQPGYFVGSAANNPENTPGRYIIREKADGTKAVSYATEKGRGAFTQSHPMENGRFVGTERPAHELTEEEKKAIKKNGEKPRINY